MSNRLRLVLITSVLATFSLLALSVTSAIPVPGAQADLVRVVKTVSPSSGVTTGSVVTFTVQITLDRAHNNVEFEDIYSGAGRAPDTGYVSGSGVLDGSPIPDPTLTANVLNRVVYRFNPVNLSSGSHTLTYQWQIGSFTALGCFKDAANEIHFDEMGVQGHLATSTIHFQVRGPIANCATRTPVTTGTTGPSTITPVSTPTATATATSTATSTATPTRTATSSPTATPSTFVVSGHKWIDALSGNPAFTDNGVEDPGEPRGDGFPIHIYDTSGTEIRPFVTTDSNGLYSFTVPAGTYTVCEEVGNITSVNAGFPARRYYETFPTSGADCTGHTPTIPGGTMGAFGYTVTVGPDATNRNFGNSI